MDLEWFDWHLEFSKKSGNHCSNVQRLVLKSSLDTASILCNILEAVTRKPYFRSSVFIAYIFPVFCLDSLFVGFALNFFFHPVSNDVLGAEYLLRSWEALSYLRILWKERHYTSRQYNKRKKNFVRKFDVILTVHRR